MTAFEYLARRIAATPGNSVVFSDHRGRPDCCPVDSPRGDALLRRVPAGRFRIRGVFQPGVCAATLAAEFRQ